MCRSIRQLRRAEGQGPATTGEARAAALQYVRKVSGFRAPPARHRAAFEAAVGEVAAATERLLASVGTDVADGPDPFADPVGRRAILEARAVPARREAMARRQVSAAAVPRRQVRAAAVPRRDGSGLAEPSTDAVGSRPAGPAVPDGSARSEPPDGRPLAAHVPSDRPA